MGPIPNFVGSGTNFVEARYKICGGLLKTLWGTWYTLCVGLVQAVWGLVQNLCGPDINFVEAWYNFVGAYYRRLWGHAECVKDGDRYVRH